MIVTATKKHRTYRLAADGHLQPTRPPRPPNFTHQKHQTTHHLWPTKRKRSKRKCQEVAAVANHHHSSNHHQIRNNRRQRKTPAERFDSNPHAPTQQQPARNKAARWMCKTNNEKRMRAKAGNKQRVSQTRRQRKADKVTESAKQEAKAKAEATHAPQPTRSAASKPQNQHPAPFPKTFVFS